MSMRPALRPGAALLRRDRHHLQVGTSPGSVIRDQPGLLQMFRLLDGVHTQSAIAQLVREEIPEFRGDVNAVVNELAAAGVICDANEWDIADPRQSDLARFLVATGRSPALMSRRASLGIGLYCDGAASRLADTVAAMLADTGFAVAAGDDVDLAIFLSSGEPSRRPFSAAVHHELDHLPVVIDEERVRIGPLVRPGRTPCMECYDRHRSEWDRAWPALATQFGKPGHTIFTKAAVSALTWQVAAADICATVATHCDGDSPNSAGQLIAVGPDHRDRTAWQVNFHPGCGCALLSVA